MATDLENIQRLLDRFKRSLETTINPLVEEFELSAKRLDYFPNLDIFDPPRSRTYDTWVPGSKSVCYLLGITDVDHTMENTVARS